MNCRTRREEHSAYSKPDSLPHNSAAVPQTRPRMLYSTLHKPRTGNRIPKMGRAYLNERDGDLSTIGSPILIRVELNGVQMAFYPTYPKDFASYPNYTCLVNGCRPRLIDESVGSSTTLVALLCDSVGITSVHRSGGNTPALIRTAQQCQSKSGSCRGWCCPSPCSCRR